MQMDKVFFASFFFRKKKTLLSCVAAWEAWGLITVPSTYGNFYLAHRRFICKYSR